MINKTNITDKSVYYIIQKALKEKFSYERINNSLIRYYEIYLNSIVVVAIEDEVKGIILLYFDDKISSKGSRNRKFDFIGLSIAREFNVIENGKHIKDISCFALGKFNSRVNYIDLIRNRGFVYKYRRDIMFNFNENAALDINFSFIDNYIEEKNGRVYIVIPWANLYFSFGIDIKNSDVWKNIGSIIKYYELEELKIYENPKVIVSDLDSLNYEIGKIFTTKGQATFDENMATYFTVNNNFSNIEFHLLDQDGFEYERILLKNFASENHRLHSSFTTLLNIFINKSNLFSDKLSEIEKNLNDDMLVAQNKIDQLNNIYSDILNNEVVLSNMTSIEIFELGRKFAKLEGELKQTEKDFDEIINVIYTEYNSLINEYKRIGNRVNEIISRIENKKQEVISMGDNNKFWISFCDKELIKISRDFKRLVDLESFLDEITNKLNEISDKKDLIMNFINYN